MGAAVIIGFINFFLLFLLVISVYNALRHKRGLIFKISCWIKNFTSRMHAIVIKTPTRKYGSLFLFVSVSIIYILHQKGIVGIHLLEW